MNNQQTCKVCGRADKFNFHITDELWSSIIPVEYQKLVVCLSCFDDFAEQKGIFYSQQIKELYFAGKLATIKFHSSTNRERRLLCSYFTSNGQLRKLIRGSIQDMIRVHREITKENADSLARRIAGQIKGFILKVT